VGCWEALLYTHVYVHLWVSPVASKVIPVRIDEELLKLIDELVRLGLYSSRSEAIRDFIRVGAARAKRARAVYQLVGGLFEMERREGDIPIRLDGALKQLLSERERF
jgi:Arc/MetJ-type ribon-helix-helix transcriptional regulator